MFNTELSVDPTIPISGVSSILHNCPKEATTQMSPTWWIDGRWYIHMVGSLPAVPRGWCTNTCYTTGIPDSIALSERRRSPKGTSVSHPLREMSRKGKSAVWKHTGGGQGFKDSFWGDENIPELGSGEGCTALWTHWKPWNCSHAKHEFHGMGVIFP